MAGFQVIIYGRFWVIPEDRKLTVGAVHCEAVDRVTAGQDKTDRQGILVHKTA